MVFNTFNPAEHSSICHIDLGLGCSLGVFCGGKVLDDAASQEIAQVYTT